MTNKIIDDTMSYKDSDIERIQAKPTVYISYGGKEGANHLAKEGINNIIDEFNNPKSVGSHGKIFLDLTTGIMDIEDDGRGINFADLEKVCTLSHAGSKELREDGSSAGENGIGLTAMNALSEIFEITSYRDDEARCIRFREGIKISDDIFKLKKHKRGLTVSLKPSHLYLGNDADINAEDIKLWLRKLSYQIDEKITIDFTIKEPGKDTLTTFTFKNEKGIGGYLPDLEPDANLLKTPLVLTNHMTLMEDDVPVHRDGKVERVSLERYIELQVAVNYNPDSSDTKAHSFTNTIENIDHGEHTRGVMTALTAAFRKMTKETLKKTDEFDITNNDVTAGLTIVVNINTTMSTKFKSQTKENLGNPAFYEPCKKLTTEAITELMKRPDMKRSFQAITTLIKGNAQSRIAATTVRKKTKDTLQSVIDASAIPGFNAPNNISQPGAYLEIYIVEGDSAGGSARAGRYNADIQGIFKLKGKPKNIYKTSDVGRSEEFKNLFTCLGTGYGKNFDYSLLKFAKIIILSDADIDGDHIYELVASGFYKHARPLIENGHVYRAVTPLYRLAHKKKGDDIEINQYLKDKNEFFEKYEDKVSDKFTIKLPNGSFISRKNMKNFLVTNRDYYELLKTMSEHYTLDSGIIEFIAANPDTFRENIKELSAELQYDKEGNSIYGVYQGNYNNIILDDIFMKKVEYLTKVIYTGNDGVLKYHFYEKFDSRNEPTYRGLLTIGECMELCQKLEPSIDSRFKGLGELKPEELRELVMNPHKRSLIRLCVEDAEEMTRVFDVLNLDSHRESRKRLVDNNTLTIEDIDN